jgi:hypothetical protein
MKHQVVNIAEAVPLFFPKEIPLSKIHYHPRCLCEQSRTFAKLLSQTGQYPAATKRAYSGSMFLLDFHNRPQTTCQSSRHTSSDMRAPSLPPVSRSSPASFLGL